MVIAVPCSVNDRWSSARLHQYDKHAYFQGFLGLGHCDLLEALLERLRCRLVFKLLQDGARGKIYVEGGAFCLTEWLLSDERTNLGEPRRPFLDIPARLLDD